MAQVGGAGRGAAAMGSAAAAAPHPRNEPPDLRLDLLAPHSHADAATPIAPQHHSRRPRRPLGWRVRDRRGATGGSRALPLPTARSHTPAPPKHTFASHAHTWLARRPHVWQPGRRLAAAAASRPPRRRTRRGAPLLSRGQRDGAPGSPRLAVAARPADEREGWPPHRSQRHRLPSRQAAAMHARRRRSRCRRTTHPWWHMAVSTRAAAHAPLVPMGVARGVCSDRVSSSSPPAVELGQRQRRRRRRCQCERVETIFPAVTRTRARWASGR